MQRSMALRGHVTVHSAPNRRENMTKKVAKRGWSLDKFTEAVNRQAGKAGIKTSKAKIETAYEAGHTVAFAVASMEKASPAKAPSKAPSKKATKEAAAA
jgi:phage-related protein